MDLTAVDRRVGYCRIVYLTMTIPLLTVISVGLFAFVPLPYWVPLFFTLLWCISVVLAAIYLYLRCRRAAYRIAETTITSVNGVWFRTKRQIPLMAVRHITVLSGPLERRLGITCVLISATGGRLLLDGIPLNESEALVRRLP